MKRLMCLLLVAVVLLSLPVGISAEGDPFDIGPIEPFEDTPDWLPEEEPGQEPEEPPAPDPDDFDGRRQIKITINDVLRKVHEGQYGEIVMDYTLRLFAFGPIGPLRPANETEYSNEGYLELDAEGEVKLKGFGNIPGMKVENKVKVDGDEVDYTSKLYVKKPDTLVEQSFERMYKEYNEKTGKSIKYRRIIAQGDIKTSISGMGSLDALFEANNGGAWAKGEQHVKEKSSHDVRVILFLRDDNTVQAQMIIPGMEILESWRGTYEIK